MSLERKVVATGDYRGAHMLVRHMGPDLLGYVGDVELSGFFIDTKAAFLGCRKYIDQQIKERDAQEDKING